MIADLMLSAAIVLAVLSPMTGSFLKCWADRARTGGSVADGRSFCDNCGETLAARDLVPILSWLMAGGKSRCCRQSISATLLLAEIAALAMAISALVVLPHPLWLPAMLLAWGLQALSLLAGADRRTALILAGLTGVGALALPLAARVSPVSTTEALIGGTIGLAVWAISTRALSSRSDAALVLPTTGALLGAPIAGLAVGIGILIALIHSRLRASEAALPQTSLAIGLATATWLCWVGLFL